MITSNLIKVFIPATMAFVTGILLAPLLTHYLYKYRIWKKTAGKTALDGSVAVEFEKLRTDTETKTPRMGGILIWASVVIVTVGAWLLARFLPSPLTEKLDFLNRNQTWIPLFTLLAGAGMGFVNDVLDIQPSGERGIRLRTRLLFVTVVSLFIGWWFYAKLGVTAIGIPTDGALELGLFIIPFFILITLGLYAGGVIDGIDGLAGGVFSSAFMAYAGIPPDQLNIAPGDVAGAFLLFYGSTSPHAFG